MNLQTKLVLLIGTTVACATLAGVLTLDALVGEEAEAELWKRAAAVADTAAKNVFVALSEAQRERDERKEITRALEERPIIDQVVIYDAALERDLHALGNAGPETLEWERESVAQVKAERDTLELPARRALFIPVLHEDEVFLGVVEIIYSADVEDRETLAGLLEDLVPEVVASSFEATAVADDGLGALSRDLAQIDDVKWVEVFDDDGRVTAHTDPTRVNQPPLPEHAAVVRRVLKTGETVREEDAARGRLNLFVPVMNRERAPIGAVEVVMDRSAVHTARARTRRILVLGGVLLLFALAGAIALGTQRLIVARIRRLLEGMARFARGESTFEVPVKGDDELSVLTQSFNQLLRTVDHTTVSREQAEAIFNAVPEALFVTTHDGVILEANLAAQRCTGSTVDRLAGKRIGNILTPLTGVEEDGTALQRGELLSDDGALDVLVSQTPVDGARNEGRVVWSAQLLTAREQADEALAKARLAVERRQRLESLGRLAGGVAHDFNNLLTVILTAAAILEEQDEEESRFAEEINAITDAARRGAKLTEQLLVLGRRKPRRERSCMLDDVVGRVTPLLQRLLDRRLELIVRLRAPGAVALISPDELEQVVLNLVLNARDACGDGGEIVVSSAVSRDGGRDEVVLAVSDNGAGMDEATAGQIFDPFFTTKVAGKGTGLGLSTVHGIVTRSDGDIELDSAPGRGTTFTVRLPRGVSEESGPSLLPDPDSGEGRAAGATVLLVEDEDAVRRATVRALKSFGYEVVAVENAERALELADSTPFDVLLTDVIMPGMKGTELADRIYERFPGKPVVFMSGYTGDLVNDNALAKASGFVAKPYKPDELAATVGRAAAQAGAA